MPVTQRWAFFDHAAVAPITRAAQQAMAEYAKDIAENGDVNERQWVDRVEQIRRLAGQLLQAEPQDIAFVKNTSEGVGIVAEGLLWQPGDNVVIAEEEYPANVYPWLNLADRGVEVRRIATRDRRIWIDDLREQIDGRTRVVSLSYVEYASGFRNDLDAIGALCRQKGVLFFVDAIQGLGVFPLDVKRSPIDCLAADGHKRQLGPEGAGLFYIRREVLDLLRPIGVGWNSVVDSRNFSAIDFRLKPNAGRYESGSLNVAGIVALGASMELLLQIGIENVRDRVLELTDYLCDQATRLGWEVYSSRRPEDKSSIVSLIVPGRDPRELKRLCRDHGIAVNARAGRLRVSPHCYNTREELDRMIEVIRSPLAPPGERGRG